MHILRTDLLTAKLVMHYIISCWIISSVTTVVAVVVFGVAACGASFVVSVSSGPVIQVTNALFGAILGPSVGLFLLGSLNKRANAKGALIGGITSLTCSLWLTFGSIMTKHKHPTLPPLSTDGCMTTMNLTFPHHNDTDSSSIVHFFDEFPMNATMTYFHLVKNQTIEISFHGLERLYSISYLWYILLWMMVTIVVGTVASFLFRGSSTVDEVDEKLLINFRGCFKWRSESSSDFRTERFSRDEAGAEAKGEMKELAEPCL